MEFVAMVRAARRMAAVAVLLLGAASAHAAPPAEIAAAAPYFPENTKALLAAHLTPEVREWMFSSFFINPQIYRKVVTEQAEKFAAATGFNPMEDVEWDVIAISDNPPTPILVALTKKDPTKALAALQKDPKTAPLLKVELVKGVPIVRVDQGEFALLPDKIVMGMAGSLKPIIERGGEAASNKAFVEQVANGPFANAIGYGLMQPAPETMQNIAANPNAAKFGGMVLARIKQIVLAMDFKDLVIVLKLDSKDAAMVAADQVKGLVKTGKGALSVGIPKPDVAPTESALEHINPKVIMTRVLALSLTEALDAITATAEGETAKITIPKDKIPILRAEGSTMFVALAAAAGGVYGAMHAKAAGSGASLSAGAGGDSDDKAQCFANQQRLTAAVELYNSDKKKKAKLEEIADQLVQAQYLESKPDDPGQAAGSFKNYQTAADGRVTCKVHGAPEAGEPAEDEKAEPEKPSPSPAGDKDEKEDGEEH